jgi:hypothetical protein
MNTNNDIVDSKADDFSNVEGPLWEQGIFLVSFCHCPSSSGILYSRDESSPQSTINLTLPPAANATTTKAICNFEPTGSLKHLVMQEVYARL